MCYSLLYRIFSAVHDFPQSLSNIATAARVTTDQAADGLMRLLDDELVVTYDHAGVGTEVWELARD